MNPKAKGLRQETALMPWIIWALAVCFYAYEFLQRVSISVYLPYLLHELRTDATGIGFMSAAYYYAYALMQLPAGLLVDWFGPKRLAVFGILLVCIGSVFFGTIHSEITGTIARFVIGIGSAFAFICAMKLIIIWFPATRFAFLAGLTNFAGYLGATLGEVPLTYFVHHWGWRVTNYFAALLGFILSLFMVFIIRDRPYSRKKTKEKTF